MQNALQGTTAQLSGATQLTYAPDTAVWEFSGHWNVLWIL
jgi:hypothetical protein